MQKQYLCEKFGVKEGGGCLLKGAVLSGTTCREELRSSVLHIIEHVSTVIVLTVMISLLYTHILQYQAQKYAMGISGQRYVSFQIGQKPHVCNESC